MIDGLLTSKITTNLNNKLLSGRIQKIYQINNNEIIFKIRANRTNYQLINSIDNNSFRLHITNEQFSTLEKATNLTMNFRKHLEGGFIKSIYQHECDRTITFEIIKHNELRDEQTKYLIFELIGRYANTVLCDADYTIIDALKFIPISQSLKRIIQRNVKYEYASTNNKLNPFNGINNSSNYQEEYQGFSKELNKEFLYLNKQGLLAQDIFNQYQNSNTIYAYDNILSFIKLSNNDKAYQEFIDLDEAFDTIYHKESKENTINHIYKKEIKSLKNVIKRNNRKIEKLQMQYNNNLDYEKYKNKGTLIYDNIYLFDKNKHYEKIDVFDYTNNKKITLTLDSKLTLSGNAAKQLKLYNKAKASFKYLKQQIELALRQNSEIEEALLSIGYSTPDDFSEIIEYFSNEHILKKTNNRSKKKKKKINYDVYYSNDNTEIIVGKNNIQNNYITFKVANKNDIWLHIKDQPGSHVVIKDSNPNNETLTQAAQLALYYSSASDKINYDVMYTPIKNLTKLKGQGLGKVKMNTYNTINVMNDSDIIKEMK